METLSQIETEARLVNELVKGRELDASFVKIFAVLDVLVQYRLDIERRGIAILLHPIASGTVPRRYRHRTACVLPPS